MNHDPVRSCIWWNTRVISTVSNSSVGYDKPSLQCIIPCHTCGQLQTLWWLQYSVVDSPVHHCSLNVETVPSCRTQTNIANKFQTLTWRNSEQILKINLKSWAKSYWDIFNWVFTFLKKSFVFGSNLKKSNDNK